jgi:hypothetical protein
MVLHRARRSRATSVRALCSLDKIARGQIGRIKASRHSTKAKGKPNQHKTNFSFPTLDRAREEKIDSRSGRLTNSPTAARAFTLRRARTPKFTAPSHPQASSATRAMQCGFLAALPEKSARRNQQRRVILPLVECSIRILR